MTSRSAPPGRRGPFTAIPADDLPDYERPLVKTGLPRLWKTFNSGDRVQVILHGEYSRTGTIDVRTPDGETVWVFLDNGMGRVAISDGDRAALVLLE